MRLVIKWDSQAARAAGKVRLDAVFMPYIAELLTPKASLHAFKASEADKVLADGTSALLAPEAEARGMSETELALSIKERHANTAAAVAALEVQRQAAQSEIDAAFSPAEIQGVVTKYADILLSLGAAFNSHDR